MHRRHLSAMSILLFICATSVFAQSALDSLQRAYVNLRFGMFICYGIETYNGRRLLEQSKTPGGGPSGS